MFFSKVIVLNIPFIFMKLDTFDNDQNPNNVTQAGDENIQTQNSTQPMQVNDNPVKLIGPMQVFSRNKVKFNRNKTLFKSVVCMNFVIKVIRFLKLIKQL